MNAAFPLRKYLWSAGFSCLLSLSAVSAMADISGLARHKQLYAVPAPGVVSVDGSLNDWDLSGQIEMFVLSEAKETQSARFALMYDASNLYLSGVVRDTTPMMNRQDPDANGDWGWNADSCQFRITLDPKRPYPETESVWPYRQDPKKPDLRADIKHLTLWYYTDKAQPALQMASGMSYRMGAYPKGVVPANLYTAKYKMGMDGRSYTFEYAIPWKTLDAAAPLRGGDVVAGTVQFNWGAADGLKTAGGSAWAYDVMAGPGFTFQTASVWGKLIFSKEGNVARELVEAGVPKEKPRPLKFVYDLPRDGQVTLQLLDQENVIRRILVAQGDRLKGRNEELWDGMDDQGKPLTAGTYRLQGVIHDPIRGEFVFSAHNSGVPPYPTDDGTGGWGGDHGEPTAASALADGLLLGWDSCEYGWGIIRVDEKGRKKWGIKSNARLLANDGERFFAYDPAGFAASPGVKMFSVEDGKPLAFAGGNAHLMAPAGGTPETDVPGALVCSGGKLYVTYPKRDLLAAFNLPGGENAGQWTLPQAQHMAAAPNGGFLLTSGGRLGRWADGKFSPLSTPAADLQGAAGLTVGPEGTIFVTRKAPFHNVLVLNSEGKTLREIGKRGGRPAYGNYDPAGMYEPLGLAVGPAGDLWVAEHADGPKRISVWDPKSGKLNTEFFGGSSYFGYANIDPARPNEIYCHNTLWKIDWDKKTTTPISTIWRATGPDVIQEPSPDAYPQGFRMFTRPGGQQFGYGIAGYDRKAVLYQREGNLFKPIVSTLRIERKNKRWRPWANAELNDPARFPDGTYLWQDANNDQRVEPAELVAFPGKPSRLEIKAVAPDMTLWLANGYCLKPQSFDRGGKPSYDATKLEKTFLQGTPHAGGYVFLDNDGHVFTHTPGQRLALVKWTADGKIVWAYPNLERWHDSLSRPVVKAGRMYGTTNFMGTTSRLVANMSYFGVAHLLQKNGIYLAAILRDGRSSGAGADIGQPEGQGGDMVEVVTHKGGKPRTFVLAGGQDGRVTEVLGLDTIQPLPGGTVTLTEEDVRISAEAMAQYNASLGKNSELVIASDKKWLSTSAPVEREVDGMRGFNVRAARDEQNLYLQYEVSTPHEMLSSAADPMLLFKGGNALDIQLGLDPAAPADRKTPAPGDLRLLVTRKQVAGKAVAQPFAVLYRPRVAGFTGEPTVLRSPTGTESFDSISVVEGVKLDYKSTPTGFTAVVTVPLGLLGWAPQPGQRIRMDVGYIFGNKTGNTAATRAYWKNNSFSANVVNDIPHESRLEPAQWGEAKVE